MNILMNTHRFLIFVMTLILFITVSHAQEGAFEEVKNNEMLIPSAPAFAMLGVNPELVTRPSDLRSFKVDWRIKNYNLAPDLALEAQPLWHFYYKKKTFEEYATISRMARKLSTASFSLGTAKIDNVNHASYSVKLNLYKKNDIISDTTLFQKVNLEEHQKLESFEKQIDSLIILRYQTTDLKRKNEIENELEVIRIEMNNINEVSKLKFKKVLDQYSAENWNTTMLDAAFGSVYTYDNGAIDSLKIKRAGFALWVNGCLKMGDNGLLSGLFRYTKIIDSSNKMFGLSYRYGSQKYNFYMELVYENLGNYFDPNQEVSFGEDEYFADKYISDVGTSWLDFNNEVSKTQYTISYGGDFKLSKNILLNFALRTQFTSDVKLTRLLPVANIVCLMK